MPSAAVLGEFCSPARPRVHDAVLDRECTYGLGFMTDLADHQFGQECSPSSFGHSGNVGSSFAFADPAFDLVVSVVYNGVVDAESAFLRRRALVRSIYEDLALHAPSADAVHHDPAPARRRRWSRRRS